MPTSPFKKVGEKIEEIVEEVEEEIEEGVEHLIHKKKKPFYKRVPFWLFLIFLITLSVLGYLYLGLWQPLKNSLILARQTQTYFEKVQTDLLSTDFVAARADTETAQNLLGKLEKNVSQLDSPFITGYLRVQYSAIEDMIEAIKEFSDGLYLLTDLSQDVLSQVKRDTKSGNLSIEPAKRKEILTKFSQKTPELNGAKAQLDLSLLSLEQIQVNKLNPALADYVLNLRVKIILLRDFLDKVVTLSETLPSLLGLGQEKTYLFLLQNNNELRPTGGFIGTLGLLKMKDGNILSFETKNVYDYDKFAQEKLRVPAPEPIKKYLNVKAWYLRDSNWQSDFPEAVKKIEWFYHQETNLSGGKLKDEKIDGIIAITAKPVVELLATLGAIDVDSFVFNKDNFVEQLQYLVEVGYQEQGKPYFQRKDIIGELAAKLINRTENLNLYGWLALVKSVFNNLEQKHVLVVTKDQTVQKLVTEQNWSGAINQNPADYLFVVDANLAALKSNECVKRQVKYALVPAVDEKMLAKVEINYANSCVFTWKSTRYRTYTRVYVPVGSELIKTTGSMDMDRSSKPGKTEVSQENNRTVFGTFIAIEPGQVGTLSFEYYLPEALAKKIFAGDDYRLYLQKQAGTLKDKTFLDLKFPQEIKSTSPSEPRSGWGDNHYQLATDLEMDREVKIGF